MQQNPIISTLRFAGLTLGVVLFAVMLYQSSQMANNPKYIKGTPYAISYSANDANRAGATDTIATIAVAKQVAVSEPSTPEAQATEAVTSPATDQPVVHAEAPVHTDQGSPAPSGKALGLSKHLE